MSLIKRNYPALPNISDLFDDDWFSFPRGSEMMPAVNVIDNTDSYEIELAAPGFQKRDFNIQLDHGVLEISAKIETKNEEKDKNYTRREFSTRSFARSFTLPNDINEEDIKARYDDGVLKLTLKKIEAAVPKRKSVKIL